MSDVELVLEVQNVELVLSSAPQGPAGPPGADGGAGSLDPATAAAAGIVKVNTDDPGSDPVVYRVEEVDTLLDDKADATDLTSEASARAAADAALDGRLDTLEAISIATDSELAAAVAAEASLRSAADSALDARVDTLEAAGPYALDADLDTEVAARAAADTTLQSNIDGKQPLHANLTALAGLVGASDRAAYFTGVGALSLYTLTAFGRTIAALADAAALRTAGGLVIGTDVQAFHSNLSALAGLSLIADRLPYANGSGTLALATFTAYGRTLAALADAAGGRTALGIVIGTDVQAFHANLTAFAGLSLVADRLPYADGTGTLALATFTSFGRTLVALADAAALRTAGGLVIGTDVAAFGDSRFPSAGEKAALAGTSGTPGSGNKYVTDGDSRNTDTRTPTDNTVSTAKLQANSVTNGKLAQMVDQRLKGNVSGGTADPSDLTQAQVRTFLGLAALALLATVGTSQIDDDAVTNAKAANMANATMKGRTTTGTGDPEDLTASQVRTLLSLVIGTDVQAWSAVLDALAAFTSISDGQTVKRSGSSYIGYTPTAGVAVSTTAPVSPSAGDLWWKSDEGVLKIYFNDGNTSQWVDAIPGGYGGPVYDFAAIP